MRGRAILLAGAILFVFLFGGLFHAVVPHSHDGNEMLWDQLHAALSHEGKQVLIASLSASLAVVLPLLVAIPVIAPAHAPLTRRDRLLHRGVSKYRRFG